MVLRKFRKYSILRKIQGEIFQSALCKPLSLSILPKNIRKSWVKFSSNAHIGMSVLCISS